MKSFEDMQYNPTMESLVTVLVNKTQASDPLFFRIMTSFYLTQVASSMRAVINTPDRGIIPINMYSICTAPSGFGKGHSTSIIEEDVMKPFRDQYKTFAEDISQTNIAKVSQQRAAKKQTDPDDELIRTQKEYESLGEVPFSFDSGTVPAFKQVRHKCLLTKIGALNFIADEIGSNLLGNTELLTAYLETYDKGRIKEKLVKNTNENKRLAEIEGAVPTNMLLFGTPDAIFDGSQVEKAWKNFLQIGYARRCFFGVGSVSDKDKEVSAAELFKQLVNKQTNSALTNVAAQIELLASKAFYDKELTLPEEAAIELLEYKLDCEARAAELPEHEQIRKAELSHRYFKVLKLSGTYAFIDMSDTIESHHIEQAIKLAEDSGKAFDALMKPLPNYVKLARYISSVDNELTHVELMENLPFYPASEAGRRDLLNNAISYGYKNNIIIKRQYNDGIEFMRGETLKETDLDKIIISYSTDLAKDYLPEQIKFDDFHVLTQAQGYHWVNHHLIDNYRKEENAIAGCNIFVIDIDGTASIPLVKSVLKGYKYHLYTTKSHTDTHHCFRVIVPLSHVVKLDPKDYKEFTENIMEFLPFDMDTQTNQRARKWLANKGHYEYNDGDLLDVLPFIPKTSRNEQRKKSLVGLENLTNLERWFINNTGLGNRSNQLYRYAAMLAESGRDLISIQEAVLALNSKLADKLDEAEISSTILRSIAKTLSSK